jgi:hypothetical protein
MSVRRNEGEDNAQATIEPIFGDRFGLSTDSHDNTGRAKRACQRS